MADRVFGWRHVALVLASNESNRLLDSLGITLDEEPVRAWARHLLSDLDDFWEVYEIDPDGGTAAETIEVELARLVPGRAMDALREGAILFARPIDGDLDDWSKVISSLPYQDRPDVPIPAKPLRADLRSQVLSLAETGASDGKRLAVRWGWEPRPEDEWVVAFAQRHGIWPFELASSWDDLRQTHNVVRGLNDTLSPADREELEAWAQAELYSASRPSHWPPSPQLRLADAARDGWHHVTLPDTE